MHLYSAELELLTPFLYGARSGHREMAKRRLGILHLCHFHAAPSSLCGVTRVALQM